MLLAPTPIHIMYALSSIMCNTQQLKTTKNILQWLSIDQL